jgi:hypothetical protein
VMPPLSVDQLGPDGAGAGVSVNRHMPNGKLGPTKCVHSRVGLWCQAVEMVGSQGLPLRASWMALMERTPWFRALTR